MKNMTGMDVYEAAKDVKGLAGEINGDFLGLADVRDLENLKREAERFLTIIKDALTSAKSLDAMNKPTAFMPTGSWVKARRSRFSNRNPHDGGWTV